MNQSFIHTRTKIALHSLGVILTALLFFILSVTVFKIQDFTYAAALVIAGEILRIAFSKRKYLMAIELHDDNITVIYLNRILCSKTEVIHKKDLEITDITEVNRWMGNLNLIYFSTGKQNISFDFIDKKIKQSVLEKLGAV